MSKKSKFDASPSMLGYLYQIRYGLYLSLNKLLEVDDPDQFNVSIEKLDDIAFDIKGSASELLQTKYHGSPGNLTDRSPDIWKTIRVWVESIKKGDIELGKVCLVLITTEALTEGSIAFYLGVGQGRDVAKAMTLMEVVSAEANKTNAKGYEAYISLDKVKLNAFVDSIYVVGQSDDLLQTKAKIKRLGRQTVPSNAVDSYVERLEGIWFDLCVEKLRMNPTGVINLGDIQNLIDELRPTYSEFNLPAEFADELPEAIDLDSDLRTFVKQLNLFDATPSIIRRAIIAYYRAYEQRAKWVLDGLINPGELSKYDRGLIGFWEDQQGCLELIESVVTEGNRQQYSIKLYQLCLNEKLPIRRDFCESYVSQGSFQMLSDELKIGWYPEYAEIIGEDASKNGGA